jgi:hypothetical protein
MTAALISSPPQATAPHEIELPPKAEFHVYVLMGQSNMAGRGVMTEADRRPVPGVLTLDKDNRWKPAAHPLHFDKPIAGVGLGIDFAKAMARHDRSATIGLIPCAVGGTPLRRWSKGGDLYENALARTRAAIRDGTLKGVLWHQGESDSSRPEAAKTYARRLDRMVADLRADLGRPKLPVVAGGLGDFFVRARPSRSVEKVNAALADLPNRVEHTGFASPKGLDHKGDEVHFSADALRELGRRYAEEMIRLQRSLPEQEGKRVPRHPRRRQPEDGPA